MTKVAIIGAGFSGIYALKYCIKEKLDCTLFEKSNNIGGVWNYKENKNSGMLKNTYTSSSISYLNPLDFPFPKETPLFPHNSIIYNHLLKYVKHFKLKKYIYLSTTVQKIIKLKDKWHILFLKNNKISKEYFDKVIICTGVHQEPNIPVDPIFKNFYNSNNIIHSSKYEKNKKKFKNKKLLIVGGGETSHDIAMDLVYHTNHKIYISIKNGQWFLSKILGSNEATDLNYSRLFEILRCKLTVQIRILMIVFVLMWGYGGSGIKEWQPKNLYGDSYFTKGREIMGWISKGVIEPCSGITSIKGKKICFHEKEDFFDYIILCTGYKTSYLSNLIPEINQEQIHYKHIFHTDDNTLSYCGFIRPIIGSIPMICELQAILISKFYSNQIELESPENQLKYTKYIESKNKNRRLNNIVLPYEYCDELATIIGCKPQFIKLFFSDQILFWKILLYPWSQYHYTITSSDINIRNIAKEQINIINNSKSGKRLIIYTLLIIILFIFFLYNKNNFTILFLILLYFYNLQTKF